MYINCFRGKMQEGAGIFKYFLWARMRTLETDGNSGRLWGRTELPMRQSTDCCYSWGIFSFSQSRRANLTSKFFCSIRLLYSSFVRVRSKDFSASSSTTS